MAFSTQITEIRDQTRTNDTTFSDADIYRKANIVYRVLVAKISDATGHKNDFINFAYGDLKKSSTLSADDLGYNGEYPFPSDCILPVRVEVKYDEDQRPVTIYDQSENTKSEWDEDDHEQFSKSAPRMRFARNSVLIRPLPTADVTAGLYWEYIALPEDIDEGTDTPEFLSIFHDALSWGVIKRYFSKNSEKYAVDLANARREYNIAEQDLISFYQDRMPKNLRFTSNPDYQTNSFR